MTLSMFRTSSRFLSIAAGFSLMGACDMPPETQNDEAEVAGASPVVADVGDRGPEVAKLNATLLQYGYFPNPQLEKSFPGFVPVHDRNPAAPDLFDDATQTALMSYQRMMGLAVTGKLDTATLEMLDSPRCAHPDGEFDIDATRKFNHSSNAWTKDTLTFNRVSLGKMNEADTAAALRRAFDTWQAITDITFVQSFDREFQDIGIWGYNGTTPPAVATLCAPNNPNCADLPDGGNILAWGFFPTAGLLAFHDTRNWYFGSDPKAIRFDQFDLESVALHEIGHVIGLKHSSVAGSAMVPTIAVGGTMRKLGKDDITGIRARYNEWDKMPGSAREIASGGGGVAILSTTVQSDGNSEVFVWNAGNSSWFKMSGTANKIAVDNTGTPWVVRADKTVWRYVNGVQVRQPGVATAIAASPDGSLWLLGTSNTEKGLARWNGSTFVSKRLNAGVNVAVDSSGVPYVTRSDLMVFRLKKTDAACMSHLTTQLPIPDSCWQQLPGEMRDIASGGDGAVYALGKTQIAGGTSVNVWNEQTAIDGVDARFAWVKLPNASGVRIAGGGPADQRPWRIDSANAIWRMRAN